MSRGLLLVTDRALFYAADPVDAYRIARARRLPGDEAEIVLSTSRTACPSGTAVEVRVPEELVRRGDRPGQVLVERAAVSADRVGRAFQPWHVDVEPDVGQRWKGYLHPVMNLTLRNLVGAGNPKDLREREDDLVTARLVGLAERPVPQTFDLEHLRAVHGRLFGDVYPWAGETRTVDMPRPGSSTFCPWDRIGQEFALVADHLQRRDRFVGLGRAEFVERITRVYDAVNRVHAFREGNGRAQREWLGDLARGAGYRLDWTVVQGWENDQACRLAHLGDREGLVAMVGAITQRVAPGGDGDRFGAAVSGLSAAEVALRGLSPVRSPTPGAVHTAASGSLSRPVAPYRADGRSR